MVMVGVAGGLRSGRCAGRHRQTEGLADDRLRLAGQGSRGLAKRGPGCGVGVADDQRRSGVAALPERGVQRDLADERNPERFRGLLPATAAVLLASALMLLAVLTGVCGIILDSVGRGRKEAKRLAYLAAASE